MTDLEAATRALHMHVAGPHLDPHTIEALIRDTYTTHDAGRHLALQTAAAIAAKLAHLPTWNLNAGTRPGVTALVLIHHHDDRALAAALLDGLDTEHLAWVCIALLGMWRDACAAAAAGVLTTAGGTEEALNGLLRAQGAETTAPGAVDAPRPADGRTA